MNYFFKLTIGLVLVFISMGNSANATDSEARKYLEAAYVAQDEQRHADAIKAFERAFASGSYPALIALVQYYISKEYQNPVRLEALIKQVEQASEQGDAEASRMATDFFSAKQFANPSKAFRHTELIIMNSPQNSQHWVSAYLRLASYYFTGTGVAKDVEAGLNTLKRAATVNGVANSQVHSQLGYLYQQLGNQEQAAKWYNSGIRAREGYKKHAKSLVATIYYEKGLFDKVIATGFGVLSNQALTTHELDDLKVLAQDSNHNAQLALAHGYAYGQLVEKNTELAHRYFKMAIANDDLSSLKDYIYWLDNHVDKSNAAAFPYIVRAAKKNDPLSAAMLSDHYLKGIGTAKNRQAARDWAVRAIQLGADAGEMVLLPALLELNPPNSSTWQFLVDTQKGGKAYTSSNAAHGPVLHNGQRIVYALNLIKYGATQTEHEDSLIFERRYTNLIDAYKINCNTQQGQLLGYSLFDGNQNVYEVINPGRWGNNTFISKSIGQRLVQRLCN